MGEISRAALDFSVEVDAPPHLAFDATRADALVTVRARAVEGGVPHGPVPSAEVLIMDRSSSMAGLGKLDEAKRAICAAVDTLREGTLLGIVAGHRTATVVYPPGGGLVRVDAAHKREAKARVAAQLAHGGTAIGTWLECARRLFDASTAPGTVRHAVLYTDGKDQDESPEELDAALAACTDRFTCDARGLGEDWNHHELRRVADALHGSAEAVIDITDLTRDFVALMERAQRVVVPHLYLGLRLNERLGLGFVHQTRPVQVDLTRQSQQYGDEIHIPLGSWSAEARQYQISLRFEAGALPVDEELRAARIVLHTEPPDGGGRVPCAPPDAFLVRRWPNPAFEVPVPDFQTRVRTEQELGMAMRACADAHAQQDGTRADRELRLALGLAEELGDERRLRLLRAVADTDAGGRAVVRRDVTRGEMQRLGLDSTRTGPLPLDAIERIAAGPAGAARRRCPHCGEALASPGAQYCEHCGRHVDDEGIGTGG
ncbi:VWA domain-containing protein [Streptomyces sp. NPDC047315]|uniref:VWA domain-containing protein n=1 Tax=Streptomyces sp. NPDC047315 TaxID=3155142 RepID=UPI0033DC9D63